jgi:hypothetical protein
MNRPFKNKAELAEFIQVNIPMLIKPVRKSRYMYISPFSSNNAMDIVVEGLTDRLWDRFHLG